MSHMTILDSQIVRPDAQRRVSLGSLVERSSYYLIHTEPGGIIVLEPAVVRSALEDKLERNPEFVEAAAAAQDGHFSRRPARRR